MVVRHMDGEVMCQMMKWTRLVPFTTESIVFAMPIYVRMGGKVINMLSTSSPVSTGNLKVQGIFRYVACVDKADKDLLVRGLSIREKEERMSNLEQMTESDRRLSWFRKPSVDKDRTLDRFEKINLRIFLASYDKDQGTTLTALEKERQRVLKDALSRNQGDMVKAANDPVVVEAAERQLNMLLQGK